MLLRTVTDHIAIADQPSVEDLTALKASGYVGIVNLRHDGEPEQPLSTADEGVVVASLGMDYLHHGVGGAPLGVEGVTSVSRFLDAHEGSGRVLVHCRKGGRAAALVLLHEAAKRGWTHTEALARGEELGLKLEGNLRLLVQEYLAARAADPGNETTHACP